MPPAILRDMRWVYEHDGDESQDNTPGRRLQREMLKADRAKFMERLWRMEREWSSVKKVPGGGEVSSSSGGGASDRDEGTEKCLKILDEWLADPSNWAE